MRPGQLRRAIQEDQVRGLKPLGVVATLGTTSTTSVDPVGDIAEIARELGLWLHVDAAYGGSAASLPELRPLFSGWEHADSIVVNPHKWLFTPIDCSVLYMKDPRQLRRAFSLTPEYLRTTEEGVARNLMDYGVALGRRFRSLKLWFVLRYFGAAGIRDRIRAHIGMARTLASWIDAEPELGARRTRAVQYGGVSAGARGELSRPAGRVEPEDHGSRQRDRRGLPLPHGPERALLSANGSREPPNSLGARGAGLGAAPGGRGRDPRRALEARRGPSGGLATGGAGTRWCPTTRGEAPPESRLE